MNRFLLLAHHCRIMFYGSSRKAYFGKKLMEGGMGECGGRGRGSGGGRTFVIRRENVFNDFTSTSINQVVPESHIFMLDRGPEC